MKIKTITFKYDSDGLSHITCELKNNKFFDIEHHDLMRVICENDNNLNNYQKQFETFEEVIDDLMTLGFDFKQQCELYIDNQFTESEINEFTYSLL
jgi:hypothetical protein